jgi:hypothetical protein
MAVRIMMSLLRSDPLQSTMIEQFSSLFSCVVFIEVVLLLQLSNLEAHVLKLRVKAERMLEGSYFKTFLLSDELILRIFFTAMAATLKIKNALLAKDSGSNQFFTSLIDLYRLSLASGSIF